MVDFSGGYVEPGVYVEPGATPTIATVGVAPTVVCLIGNGVGYHTNTETISFASSASGVLSQKGIDPSSIVIRGYVTDPNVAGQSIPKTFVVTTDYTVATDTTGGADNSVTTITKASGSTIETAYPQVTVSYRYTDTDYHSLHQFEDLASFNDTYGPALDPTSGALVSPLTMAATVAIQNGANEIWAIALNPAAGTVSQQFAAAYQLLSGSNTSVNLVVPLWDGVTSGGQIAGMLATLNAFLQADANTGTLRLAVVGLDQAYAGTPTDVATLASGISSTRIIMAYPHKVNYYNGVLNQTLVADGIYLAAGYAGVLAANDPQMPLTKKLIQGFSGVPSAVGAVLTSTNRKILATGGVTVSKLDRQSRLRVQQGLTTNFDGGILTREISLVRAQDALYNLLQNTMESSGLIGIPIGVNTALQVKSVVAGSLETAKTTGVIVDYNSLVVREQAPPSGDPTVIEVMFAYRPSWPLNYILVSFTVDTTTGDTTATTTTAA